VKSIDGDMSKAVKHLKAALRLSNLLANYWATRSFSHRWAGLSVDEGHNIADKICIAMHRQTKKADRYLLQDRRGKA
jgi:hypothetical protein